MKYALHVFATANSIRIDELARIAEERGFESLWVPEHTHIPASMRTLSPAGTPVERHYSACLDPFVGLAAAAMATTKLKIGTGVSLVIQHDPIVLAKEIATLDLISNGRFIFGIGAGWNAEEMGNHGTEFKTRRQLLRERIQAMKEIWTKEKAEFHGKFVNFDPIWSEPKPVQKPYPPILMGGMAPAAMRAAINYCDGWIPIPGRHPDPLGAIAQFRAQAAAAGRENMPITLFWAPPDRAKLDQYEKAGVERAIFQLGPQTREELMPKIDQYTRLIGS